jgi:4a-hydroxytetrahydrobiopterin dehydratase
MAQVTQTQLLREKCVACRADSPHVTDVEIAERHPLITEWRLVEEGGIPKLDRVFRFPDFAEALAFTTRVGEAAEREGHHPRIVTEWGRVSVTWWTHKIRNLHRNDFIMAAKTDQILQEKAGRP